MTKIYLSSGHQGKGTGASGFLDEGVETIAFTNLVYNNLPKSAGVSRSRTGISLSQKIKDANAFCTDSNDLNIEFHFNASADNSPNGCEVLISDRAGALTRKRAKELQSLMADTLHIKSRGVKLSSQSARGRLAFLESTKATALIVEICFITNKYDVDAYCNHKSELAVKIAAWLNKL